MESSKPRLEDSKDYAAFKRYCRTLVFQDGDTSYRRMLYFLATLFPGETGCPMKMRPRKDWAGTVSDVFQLAFRIQAGMDIWFQEEREGYWPTPKKKVVCLWFDTTELYLLFHREVCRELGLNKSRDRAVAALVTWDERDESVKDNYFCDEIWGYQHIGVPEFDSDFYPRQPGEEEWEQPYEKAKQAFFQARQELYDKWKKKEEEEGQAKKQRRFEEESEEEESSEEEEESEEESDAPIEKKAKNEEIKLPYNAEISLQMVRAILTSEEFKTLTEIKELTPDHLVKTADLLLEKAPWLADEPRDLISDTSVDSLLRSMFPWHAMKHHFDKELMACRPVYITARHPRNYQPEWCIYCDECREPINGPGFHKFAHNYDLCGECFSWPKGLGRLKRQRMHPFQLDLSRFDEQTVKQTREVANDMDYRVTMHGKSWAKKRVAFEKHMHREPQEPMGDLVAKTLAYLASKGKNDYTVKEIKEGEKMHGVVISGGETRKVIAGDSAEEVWVQIERLY